MLVVAGQEQLPVAEARDGKGEAWLILFRRYRLPIYAYVFELLHDEQASLDVVQETFVAATRHIAALRDDDKFGGWLFGIAHQKCLQQWRKENREAAAMELLAAAPEEFDDGPGELLVRREQEARFMKLLDQLPPPHRAVLLLHFLEGFSIEEIAEITGANPGTVKSRIHYAKKSLRKLLEEP
jgi:RNA polymerase sigma-70 factor (ECF subfamily)